MSFFVILISFGYAMTLLCLAMPALRYKPIALARSAATTQYMLSAVEARRRTHHQHSFTIIIVYRNEIAAFPKLLESLKEQSYDKDLFEIILVNDYSTDASLELSEQFAQQNQTLNIKFLNREPHSNSAKKDGITQALEMAKNTHILLTDADCILPKKWIASFNNHYQNYADALLVAAPIKLTGNGFIAAIQQLEMVALQAVTAGAFAIRQPFMCNGANLSFRKDAFEAVEGYAGNDHLSSGDDVFLLEKLAAEDVIQCHYLKSQGAMVQTASKSSCKDLIHQRARWARKGKETKSLLNKLLAFQVAAMSLLFIICPILWLTDLISLQLLVGVYLLKFFTDFVVLVIGNQFLEMEKWSLYFLPNFLIYPFLVIAIGIKSFGKIEWRGKFIDHSSPL